MAWVSGDAANRFTDLMRGAWTAFLATALAMEILFTVAKGRPVQWAVIAFILWFVVNYAVHYLFFTWQTDFEIVRGTLQAAIACVTAWLLWKWRQPSKPPEISN
jgi:hypothetical protein